MIIEFGEPASLKKIGALDKKDHRHRPDKDTGEDGPDDREYKLYKDVVRHLGLLTSSVAIWLLGI